LFYLSTAEYEATFNVTHLGTAIDALVWSPDSQHVATHSYQGTRVWDAMTGKQVAICRDLTHGALGGLPLAIGWSPPNNAIASGFEDGTARLWEAATGKQLFTYAGHSSQAYDLVWSPDGQLIA